MAKRYELRPLSVVQDIARLKGYIVHSWSHEALPLFVNACDETPLKEHEFHDFYQPLTAPGDKKAMMMIRNTLREAGYAVASNQDVLTWVNELISGDDSALSPSDVVALAYVAYFSPSVQELTERMNARLRNNAPLRLLVDMETLDNRTDHWVINVDGRVMLSRLQNS